VLAMGVSLVTREQFERFQSGMGRGGGPGGPGGQGGWGHGGGPFLGGQIVAINGNEINVQSRRGPRVIVINDKTTFSKEGQTATLKDFKVGDRILAVGEVVNGQFVAKEIRPGHPGGPGGPGGIQGPPQNPPNSN